MEIDRSNNSSRIRYGNDAQDLIDSNLESAEEHDKASNSHLRGHSHTAMALRFGEATPPPDAASISINDDSSTTADDDLQQQQHLGMTRQYWRDMILGANDGLVSTFLLVAGVAGGGLSSRNILLTAISGALAGAVSMCAGEYVATKSQNQVLQGEIALEETHVVTRRNQEIAELSQLFALIGISASEQPALHRQLTDFYKQHPEALLKIMVALEFGVLDDEVRSPIRAGLFSCVLFIGGSLPSVVPFACSGDDPLTGLVAAAICTAIALLAVGAVKSWATRGNCWTAAMENLTIAGFGGAFAYGVGVLFDMILK